MNKLSSKILALSLAGFLSLSTLSMASAVPYDKAELTQENLQKIDFSSHRLLVKGEYSIIDQSDNILDSYEDVYLLGYENDNDTKDAFEKYYQKADIVVPDFEIAVSDFTDKNTEKVYSGDTKPFTELKDDNFTGVTILNIDAPADSSDTEESKAKSTIALIDTGVPESVSESVKSANFTDSEKSSDIYGHGSEVYKVVKEQDNESDIVSAKAYNDTGAGSVAGLYAAIKYADEQKADFINISTNDYFKLSNQLIDSAIDEAVGNGAVVIISASGNDDDKNEVVYEELDKAVVIGDCAENGESRLSESLNGEAEYTIISDNAEKGAAEFTGWLAYNYNQGYISYESDKNTDGDANEVNNFDFYKDAIEDVINEGYVYKPDYKAPAATTERRNYKSAGNGVVINGTGQDVVDYALQFVGNPYVWGGEDLENGVDCSGFTMKVYEHFGYTLPHNADTQTGYGVQVSEDEMLPGDLVFYYDNDGSVGHVAIYMGNGQVVHASNHIDGIKISNQYNYRAVACVTRLIQSEPATDDVSTSTDATEDNNIVDSVADNKPVETVAETQNNEPAEVVQQKETSVQNDKGEWKEDETGSWFEYPDGTYPTDQWAVIDDSRMYFNESGYLSLNLSEMKFAVASVNSDTEEIVITEPQLLNEESEPEVAKNAEVTDIMSLNDENIEEVTKQEHTIVVDNQFSPVNTESLNTDAVKTYISEILTPVKSQDTENTFYELNKDSGYSVIEPEVQSELKNGDLMYFGGEWYAFIFIDAQNYGFFKLDNTNGLVYAPNAGFTLDGTFYRKEIKKSSISVPDAILTEAGLELYSISLPDTFIWYDEKQAADTTGYYTAVFTNNNILTVLPEKKEIRINISSAVKPEDAYTLTYTTGLTLKSINLPDGWAFENEDTTLDVGTGTYTASHNYESKQVTVTVNKGTLSVQGAMITVIDSTKLTNDLLPKYDNGHLEWKESGKVVNANTTISCTFIPDDTAHYNNSEVNVIVNVVPKTIVNDNTGTEQNKDNSSASSNTNNQTTDKSGNSTDTNKTNDTEKKNDTDSSKSQDTSEKKDNSNNKTPDVPKINIDTDKNSSGSNNNSGNNSGSNNSGNNNSNSDSSGKKSNINLNTEKSDQNNQDTNKSEDKKNDDTKKDTQTTEKAENKTENIDLTSKSDDKKKTDNSDNSKVYIPNIDLTTGTHTATDATESDTAVYEGDTEVVTLNNIDLTASSTDSDASSGDALENIDVTKDQNVNEEGKKNSGVLGAIIAGAAILGGVAFIIFKGLRKRRYR